MVFSLKIKGKVSEMHPKLDTDGSYEPIGVSIVLEDGSGLDVVVGNEIILEVQK